MAALFLCFVPLPTLPRNPHPFLPRSRGEGGVGVAGEGREGAACRKPSRKDSAIAAGHERRAEACFCRYEAQTCPIE